MGPRGKFCWDLTLPEDQEVVCGPKLGRNRGGGSREELSNPNRLVTHTDLVEMQILAQEVGLEPEILHS